MRRIPWGAGKGREESCPFRTQDHTASGSDLFVPNRSIYFDVSHASALGLPPLQKGDIDRPGLLLRIWGQRRCHSYTNRQQCDCTRWLSTDHLGKTQGCPLPKGKGCAKACYCFSLSPTCEGRDAHSHAAPCLTDLHRAISSSCGFFPIQHLGGKCGTPGTQLQPAHTLIARSRAFRLHIPSSRTAL